MAYFREIIVKFEEGNTLRETDGQLESDDEGILKDFLDLIKQIQGASARQSFPRLSRRLRKLKKYPLDQRETTLELFVRVRLNVPIEPEKVNAIVEAFDGLDAVEYATLALLPSQNPPSTTAPNFTENQLDLDSDGGVNARAVWRAFDGRGGRGFGIRVCDCEWSFFGHRDLRPDVSLASSPLPTTAFEIHGTQVLGVLGATPGLVGVTGICHRAELSFSTVEEGALYPNELMAIDHAMDDELADFRYLRTDEGDVLLVEMTLKDEEGEDHYVPIDGNTDVWTAIHDASTYLGITVIIPAGNRGIDLSEAGNSEGKAIWNEARRGHYADSLAVIVGAGRASAAAQDVAEPHSRLETSNSGTRVNCQGWGEHIYTTGGALPDGETEQSRQYTDDFGQTSGAAAMIAGVVACLQAVTKSATGAALSPTDVRDKLSNDDYGTPQPDDADDNHIGPLPNLATLLGL